LRRPRFRAGVFRTEHIADPQIGSLAGKISELDPGCRRNIAVRPPPAAPIREIRFCFVDLRC
jgi:hypothetical protein